MNTVRNLYGAVIIATALATPAIAQVAGLYGGTSADGNSVYFTVSTDVNTGNLAVTEITIGFAAPCKNSNYVLKNAPGVSTGLDAEIRNGKATISVNGSYLSFDGSLEFASDGQTAAGTIRTTSTTLTSLGAEPMRALICTSPKQHVTVTLQPGDAIAHEGLALAPGVNRIILRSARPGD